MKRKAITVPGEDTPSIRARVRDVWAKWVGNDDRPDLPDGWIQVGVNERGEPVYGHLGPRNPGMWFRDIDDMRDQWGR